MIEVNGLVKKYGSHTAVDHLNFRIEKGHIYGLLGPNGAGKSTTMNIMTGYLGATEGEVLINGHDILKEPELAKKSVGYLPEMPPLYMDMKVQEYLMFAAELKKVKKADRKAEVKKIMKMVRIYDVRERLIKNLSKGYRQRVGLAQAVLGFPETIILDEPTVGLDPKQIIEITSSLFPRGNWWQVIRRKTWKRNFQGMRRPRSRQDCFRKKPKRFSHGFREFRKSAICRPILESPGRSLRQKRMLTSGRRFSVPLQERTAR